VEAAGVEPASEQIVQLISTCLGCHFFLSYLQEQPQFNKTSLGAQRALI